MGDKINRRTFLGMTAAGAAGLILGDFIGKEQQHELTPVTKQETTDGDKAETISFYDTHQAGVITPQQNFANVAAFDITTDDRQQLQELFKTWTEMAATLMEGKPLAAEPQEGKFPPVDTGSN